MADDCKAGGRKAGGRKTRGTTPEEAALAPFFAAARRAPPEPSVALLSAILADAAEAAAPRPSPAPRPPVRARWRAALGGWGGATALAACAMLGFWIGLAGGVTIDGATLQAGAVTAADADDPVEAFFALAAVE
jgi:hypothetical protein